MTAFLVTAVLEYLDVLFHFNASSVREMFLFIGFTSSFLHYSGIIPATYYSQNYSGIFCLSLLTSNGTFTNLLIMECPANNWYKSICWCHQKQIQVTFLESFYPKLQPFESSYITISLPPIIPVLLNIFKLTTHHYNSIYQLSCDFFILILL